MVVLGATSEEGTAATVKKGDTPRLAVKEVPTFLTMKIDEELNQR